MIIHGRNGVVKFANGTLNEVQDFTYTETVSAVDGTSMGDQWEKHLAGIPSWSMDVKCFFDKSDADGQETVRAGSSLIVSQMAEGNTSGSRIISGTATVMDVMVSAAKGGIVERSFKLKGNGASTIALVP